MDVCFIFAESCECIAAQWNSFLPRVMAQEFRSETIVQPPPLNAVCMTLSQLNISESDRQERKELIIYNIPPRDNKSRAVHNLPEKKGSSLIQLFGILLLLFIRVDKNASSQGG